MATTAHLLALKVLAARPKDLEDITWLLEDADDEDIQRAREALELIIERGFDREKDLLGLFDAIQAKDSNTEVFIERDLGIEPD